MKTAKHYVILGGYFGVIAFIVVLVRALPSLPEKLAESSKMPWWDIPLGLLLLLLFGATMVLFAAGIGWLVGRLQLNAEKRARGSEKSLISRR